MHGLMLSINESIYKLSFIGETRFKGEDSMGGQTDRQTKYSWA